MADPLPDDVAAHLSMAMQTPGQAAAATPANAIVMDQPASVAGPTQNPLNLPPDVIAHMASATSPFPDSGALTDAFVQPVDQKTPDGPPLVDKYKDMGDWFLAPDLWKDIRRSPLAIIGALNADRDSVEGIIKKAVPGAEVKHDDGNLVITYKKGEKPYVFRTGQPQASDFLRSGLGTIAYGAGGAIAGAVGAAAGAPMAAGLLATGLVTHGLGALRGYAGGAPASFLEDAGAMALHGLIHGAGTLAGTIANQGTVAPGLRAVVPPEGPTLIPAGAPGSSGVLVGTTVPEAVPPIPGAPVGAPAEPPPGSVPAIGGTPGATGSAPPATPSVNPAVKELVDRADETIRGVTRELDRSKMNSDVLGYHVGEVERFNTTARDGYKAVDKAMVGKDARTERTLKFIDDEAAKLKNGHADLPKWVRDLYDKLSPAKGESGAIERPTYHNVDVERKGVGDMLESLKRQGPNPKFRGSKALAKGIYKTLSEDQLNSIADPAVKEAYTTAKSAKILQFQTQDKIVQLFGKQMGKVFEGDLGPKLESSIRPLSDGVSTMFQKMVDALPPQMRSDAIMSSISNMFGNVGAGEPLQLGKFETWFRRTMSNGVARRTLTDNLNSDAMQGLRDLYSITQQLKGVGAEAAEQKLAKEGELAAAKEGLGAAQQELKDSRALASRLAKRSLGDVDRRAKSMSGDLETKEALARFKAGDKAVQEAQKAVARAERASQVAAAKPGLARKVAAFGTDVASYHGEGLGMGARLANRVTSMVPDISSSLAFRRLSKAYNLPTPEMIDLLRRSVAASSGGVPGRLGAPGKPNDSDLVKVGAQ